MNIFSMTIEIILSALLVIAIIYCWRLDKRLTALRTGRDGMLAAAVELQQSVSQAEAAVGRLKQSADASGRDLQSKIDEARAVSGLLKREDGGDVRRPADGLRRRSNF